MHIVFVTSELATCRNTTGGLGTFTANIASIFSNHGHDVDVILASTKDEDPYLSDKIKIYSINILKNEWDILDSISKTCMHNDGEDSRENRIALQDILKGKQVGDLIERINTTNKIDVIHFSNHGAFSLFLRNDIPYVIRISGFLNIVLNGANIVGGSLDYKDNKTSMRNKMEELAIEQARNVFAPSMLIADMAKEIFKKDVKVLESPYTLEIDGWNDSVLKQSIGDVKYVLFYGKLSISKGIHVIKGIMNRFLKNNKDVSFVVCGTDQAILVDGNIMMASEYLTYDLKEEKERVIYLGSLTRELLYPIISAAEAVVLPSRIENLSNACIEAMALGKIVIGTDGASFEQLIENGVSGFLCERDNSDDFLSAVEKSLRLGKEEKIRMEDAARRRINELEPDKVYENFLEYYEAVIHDWNDK